MEKKITRRSFLAAAAAVGLSTAALSLAGCGASSASTAASAASTASTASSAASASKEPVTIEFWNGWTGPDGDLLTKLVDQYNEKNQDNVTVKMDIMEFSSLTEKLTTALASGTNPQLHLGFATGEYSLSGQYIPIDDVFDVSGLDKNDFDESILANCYMNDHLYGLPFQLTCEYFYWNKDLFQKAGLDPETPPKTWEEVASFSKKIDALGGNTIGGGYTYNDSTLLGTMMRSFGGNVIEDVDGAYASALTSDKNIASNKKALQTIYDFAHQADSNMWKGTDYEAGFMAGTVGMLIGGAWELAGCKTNKINYGISLLPAGDAGIKMATWPISMCVMKGTTGRKLEACYSFMNYWNNNINNPITDECPAFEWTSQQAYQPYLKSVQSDSRLTSDPDYQVTSSFTKYLDNYFPADFWNTYNLGTKVLGPLAENYCTDAMSIDDAFDQAETDLEGIISDMHDVEANAVK